MGWVAGAAPRRRRPPTPAASASSPAPPWTSTQLRRAIAEVKAAHRRSPFGVNLRADAADIDDRIELLIDEGVRVASFAQAPKRGRSSRSCTTAACSSMPSIGAKRHAEKVLEWGVDAVLAQGGEGGGHTGSVPTTLLLPQVVDAVQAIPVIAAGGFFDGRGLVAALAYGADGIAMGTRFLLTADSAVPRGGEGALPRQGGHRHGRHHAGRRRAAPGAAHRAGRRARVGARQGLGAAARAAQRVALPQADRHPAAATMAKEGLAMRKSMDLTWTQTLMAANTPMLLKAALVDGKVESGRDGRAARWSA